MPSATQLIPQYNVPHVATYINDNSTVNPIDTVTVASPSVRLLYVFASPKGEDSVIKEITDTAKYLKTYGTPNMDLYGQAGYMPYLSLSTTNARCFCVRVMPTDAYYANAILVATPEVIDNVEGFSGTRVTYEIRHFTQLDTTDCAEIMERASNAVTPGSGLKPGIGLTAGEYIVAVIVSKGRGKYGNDTSFRIATNTSFDRENAYKNYRMEVINTENGAVIDGAYSATLLYNSIVNGSTMYLEDKVNDPESGDTDICMYINETSLNNIYNTYVANVANGTTPVPMKEFDFLFGYIKNTAVSAANKVPNYDVVTTGFTFDGEGIPCADGTDGGFDTTDANRLTNIKNEYLKAFFKGTDADYLTQFPSETTRRYIGINSRRRTPVDVFLDAAYDSEVKTQLIQLVRKRASSKVFIDGCSNGVYPATVSALIAKDSLVSGISSSYALTEDYEVERLDQWYKTRDPFNGKVINVSATYALATMIPNHFINFGAHIPMVGERYALIPGVIPGSMRPNIDADDLDTKETLYNYKINTIDTLSESKYIIATQRTSQTKVSDLSEGSNVAVMFDMKNQLENLVLGKIYEFAEAEDRARFTDDAESIFGSYRNNKVRDFTVRFDMNEFEAERNILHCYLEIIFKQISTRAIVEIDINKRTV